MSTLTMGDFCGYSDSVAPHCAIWGSSQSLGAQNRATLRGFFVHSTTVPMGSRAGASSDAPALSPVCYPARFARHDSSVVGGLIRSLGSCHV